MEISKNKGRKKKMKKTTVIMLAMTLLLTITTISNGDEKIDVMLDWFPNIDHLPLYVAQEKGFFQEKNLDVEILSPSETSDSLKLAAYGKVDIAVAYEPQIIAAASRGLPLTAGARLIKHPLSTLLFLENSGIQDPSDLEGKVIGYTVPGMMDILVEAFAKVNGINDLKLVNVGFSIVQSLTSGKVDAIMGPYKNYETVALAMEGYSPAYFPIEEYGIPDYDELVFITSSKNFENRKRSLGDFAGAIEKAVEYIRTDPEGSVDLFMKIISESSHELERKAFRKTIDLYAENGNLDHSEWQIFADFAKSSGIIDEPVNVTDIIRNWNEPDGK